MRIILKLKAKKDCEYDQKYYHKLQGFIYGLIKETEYSVLHDKKGYKFFCFSNLFPIGDIKTGDVKKLIISSPDNLFIKLLQGRLKEFQEVKKQVNIGEMLFEVEDFSVIKVNLKRSFSLISATPIVIRIPEGNYQKYSIPEEFMKKRYVFWRPEYSFEAFIKQLEENLFKKYNEFYKTKIKEFPIFEQFKYKKSVVSHIILNGKEYKIPGSTWEFIFSYLNLEQKKILEFGVECGFGERNSLGFGFVNVI